MSVLIAVTVLSAAFLLTSTHHSPSAYGCITSSNATHTNSSSGVNGTFGNLTKSALTSPGQIFGVAAMYSGPGSAPMTAINLCQHLLVAGGGGGGGSAAYK